MTALRGADAAERRWTRGAWLTAGGALLFTLFQLLTFGFSTSHPTDGCLISQGTSDSRPVRACIGSWPTPLRPGDEVLAVSGRNPSLDIQSAVPPPPPSDWVVGGSVPYAVRRDGVTQTLDVTLHQMGWGEVARLVGFDAANQLVNLLVMLVVTTVFVLRPGNPATRLLLVGLGLSALTQSAAAPSSLISEAAWNYWPASPFGSAAIYLGFSTGWLGLPATLFLLLQFPRRLWPVTRRPRVTTALIFSIGGAASLLMLLTNSALPFLLQTALYSALMVVVLFVAIASARLQVSDPVIRAQTAWMGLGFAALSAQIFLWLTSVLVPSFGTWLDTQGVLQVIVSQMANLALPVCLAIAITRYHLFDIDLIVNRALVYLTLTILLALTYLFSVVALEQVVVPILGSGDDVVVAASTLAIAVLFQPLRRRIQTTIDRRFFRHKYDASRVLAAFGAKLRDEVDLDTVSRNLIAAVAETMEPAHASLNLRHGSPVAREES
jgi:hypothetical protein